LVRAYTTTSTLSLHDALPIFLRRTAVIRAKALSSTGERDISRVMEVVVPERVESLAALIRRPHQVRFLWLVFRDEERRTPRRRLDRKSTRLNSSHVAISYAVF